MINRSIASWVGAVGSLTLGYGTRTMLINDAACVILRLPGGGGSTELIGNTTICNVGSNEVRSDGRFVNSLLSQTIALGLNIGVQTGRPLSDFVLQVGKLYTALPIACGSNVAKPRCVYVAGVLVGTNEYIYREFSLDLINAIKAVNGGIATVGGLFKLASYALGDKDGVLGSEGALVSSVRKAASLTEIAGAAGSINEVFDECRISVGWNLVLTPCPLTQTITENAPRITAGANGEVSGSVIDELRVSAFPNPFRNNVKFVIESPVTDQAVLEVYNITGQKISTVFNGYMQKGETKVVEYRPGVTANSVLIYKLRVGNKLVTGKLVSVN